MLISVCCDSRRLTLTHFFKIGTGFSFGQRCRNASNLQCRQTRKSCYQRNHLSSCQKLKQINVRFDKREALEEHRSNAETGISVLFILGKPASEAKIIGQSAVTQRTSHCPVNL